MVEYGLKIMQVHAVEFVKAEALKSAAKKNLCRPMVSARSVSTGPRLCADREYTPVAGSSSRFKLDAGLRSGSSVNCVAMAALSAIKFDWKLESKCAVRPSGIGKTNPYGPYRFGIAQARPAFPAHALGAGRAPAKPGTLAIGTDCESSTPALKKTKIEAEIADFFMS